MIAIVIAVSGSEKTTRITSRRVAPNYRGVMIITEELMIAAVGIRIWPKNGTGTMIKLVHLWPSSIQLTTLAQILPNHFRNL
jgi:hypothetical protein